MNITLSSIQTHPHNILASLPFSSPSFTFPSLLLSSSHHHITTTRPVCPPRPAGSRCGCGRRMVCGVGVCPAPPPPRGGGGRARAPHSTPHTPAPRHRAPLGGESVWGMMIWVRGGWGRGEGSESMCEDDVRGEWGVRVIIVMIWVKRVMSEVNESVDEKTIKTMKRSGTRKC